MTLKEGNLWYKFKGPSCYGNRVVYSFHSAMVWNAYHALQLYEMHTSAKKCIPVLILKSQIFLKSINSLFCGTPTTTVRVKGLRSVQHVWLQTLDRWKKPVEMFKTGEIALDNAQMAYQENMSVS